MKARLFILASNGDPIEVLDFDTTAKAKAHAEMLQPELVWGDARIGLEAMTEAEAQHLDKTGEYPERYFQITGIDPNTNEDAELPVRKPAD